MIKPLLSLLLALGVVAGAQADTGAALPPADQVIRTATEEVQMLIHDNHDKYVADMGSFYTMVDAKIVPHFDTRGIAQLVLGKNWKNATPEQRTRFEAAFKNSLIRTYARALLDYYDSVKAEWAPVRAAPGATDATVNCKLLRANNAPPIPLAFSVHVVDKDWKIYDIAVENLSLVTNFRAQVNSEVTANGMDKTIEKFEKNEVHPEAAPAAAKAGA